MLRVYSLAKLVSSRSQGYIKKKSEMLRFQIPILCYSLPAIGVVYLRLLLRKL
jgi:hypothetical protein